jgi:hypothetical protein
MGRPATFDRARIVSLRKGGMGATETARAVGCKRETSGAKGGRAELGASVMSKIVTYGAAPLSTAESNLRR